MSIKYKFYDTYWDIEKDEKYVMWRGKYTRGWSDCRGTRVWLLNTCAKSFDVDLYGNTTFNDTIEYCDVGIFERINDDNVEACPDTCCMVTEKLENVINDMLTNDNIMNSCMFVKDDNYLLEEFCESKSDCSTTQDYFSQVLKYKQSTEEILLGGGCSMPTQMWFVDSCNKNNMINELREVLSECQKNKVRFHSV